MNTGCSAFVRIQLLGDIATHPLARLVARLPLSRLVAGPGLPPAGSPSFAKLKAARDAFKKFFQRQAGGKLPGLTYDFYQPPIPVRPDTASVH